MKNKNHPRFVIVNEDESEEEIVDDMMHFPVTLEREYFYVTPMFTSEKDAQHYVEENQIKKVKIKKGRFVEEENNE